MTTPQEAKNDLANNIRNKDKYQGWWNCQTWCVALTLNNTKRLQDQVLEIFRGPGDNKKQLKAFCNRNAMEIYKMAPWAWPGGFQYGFNFDSVNFTELYLHFNDKVREIWRVENE